MSRQRSRQSDSNGAGSFGGSSRSSSALTAGVSAFRPAAVPSGGGPSRRRRISAPWITCSAGYEFYAAGTPTAADVLLLVEVADASLAYDRHRKVPLYAARSIAETWLVDLTVAAVEIFRDPSPTGYRKVLRLQRGEVVAPIAFPDLVLRPENLLELEA